MNNVTIKQMIFKLMAITLSIMLLFNVLSITTVNPYIQAASVPEINKKTLNVLIGKTKQLSISNKGTATITWSSKNQKIATVSTGGKVKGIKNGNTEITAKLKVNNKNYTLKCKVTVIKSANKITITDNTGFALSTAEIYEGDTLSLKATVSPKNSKDIISSWTSKDKSIAKVNKKGKVTAVSEGTTTITATSFGKTKANIKITVRENEIDDEIIEEPTTPAEEETQTPINPNAKLKDVFESYFKVGNAVTPEQLQNETTLNHIKDHYNSITMENVMKPFYIMGYSPMLIDKEDAEFSVPDSYKESKVPALRFDVVDNVLEIAKNNGLSMRGHTLVWHSQTPSWFFYEDYDTSKKLASKAVMNSRMEYYIQQVLLHVQSKAPGVIYAWDVVNEMFADNGDLRKAGKNMGAGESLWTSIYKSNEFALKAFEYADKYREDGVKLFYNDYNEYISGKRDAIVSLAKTLYEKGHIDGIGMQSHLDLGYPSIELIEQAIDEFSSVAPDFEVQLTEIDVTMNYSYSSGYVDKGQTNKQQADFYGDLIKMLLSKKQEGVNITNITFWGLYDEVSWRKAGKPLIFSSGFKPKAAFTSIVNAAN